VVFFAASDQTAGHVRTNSTFVEAMNDSPYRLVSVSIV
jgi:hypothetical protein